VRSPGRGDGWPPPRGGAGAVLSHRSAAALWGLRPTTLAEIEISASRKVRSRPGVQTYRLVIPSDEVTVVEGIPVTSSPRTLLDLATVIGPRALARAVEQSEVLRLTDALSLPDLVARHRGRRGVPAVRRILARERVDAAVTRSRSRTASSLSSRTPTCLARTSTPRLELSGGWIEVDCMWRGPRVMVELDGYASHRTREAFERDRARDRALQAARWHVVRVTWRHLHETPDTVAAELRALLSPATAPPNSP
jgi:hypothetical protein